jgi:hypothetical protein
MVAVTSRPVCKNDARVAPEDSRSLISFAVEFSEFQKATAEGGLAPAPARHDDDDGRWRCGEPTVGAQPTVAFPNNSDREIEAAAGIFSLFMRN